MIDVFECQRCQELSPQVDGAQLHDVDAKNGEYQAITHNPGVNTSIDQPDANQEGHCILDNEAIKKSQAGPDRDEIRSGEKQLELRHKPNKKQACSNQKTPGKKGDP